MGKVEKVMMMIIPLPSLPNSNRMAAIKGIG